MSKKRNPRVSAGSVSPRSNIRAEAVYPVPGTKRTLAELKSVGIRLTAVETVRMATAMLVLAQTCDEIDITAWRDGPRASDGTRKVTVTARGNRDCLEG